MATVRLSEESAPQFTPGPWNVDPSYPCDVQVNGNEVATFLYDRRVGASYTIRGACSLSLDEAEANARLAAAAPELYEAACLALVLIECLQEEEGHSPSTAIPASALRAALSSARGEQGK